MALNSKTYAEAIKRKAELENVIKECDAEIAHLNSEIDRVESRKSNAEESLKLYTDNLALQIATYVKNNPPKEMSR